MKTVRGRFAVAYAAALGTTVVVLGIVIQVLQQSAANGEIDRRVRAESDLVASVLAEFRRARANPVVTDPETGQRVLSPEVAAVLEGVPGYMIVLGPNRTSMFLSPDARALSFSRAQQLVDTAQRVLDSGGDRARAVDLGPPAGRMRYFVRRVTDAGPEIAAVMTGVTSGAPAELDARVRAVADLTAAILSEARQSRDTVVVPDRRGGRELVPELARQLGSAPGVVLVVGTDRAVVYRSSDGGGLPFAAVQDLISLALQSEAPGSFGLVDLGAPVGRLRYFARPVEETADQPPLYKVIAGARASSGSVAQPRFFAALLWTIPIMVVVSLGLGYLLVGRTLRPLDNIVDEAEAITDGRSLHRRLGEPESHDELARLTRTLNAMLSRLEQSFSTLRRFTADASHELKTPLTVLRSGVERSITHPDVPQDVLEILEELLFEVNRMSEMVDSLLTLARADEGRAPLHLDDVDLRDVLAEVDETASILGEQAGVSVAVDVPEEPLPMRADRSRLRQLLMNLLTNAIKYTPRGGDVWIDSETNHDEVVIKVKDAGMGIAPGDLPHIFERFWRADPARSRTGSRPGAGLGLAISRWIAEAHGGKIEVQSRPGRGTTFTVTLPRGSDVTEAPDVAAGAED